MTSKSGAKETLEMPKDLTPEHPAERRQHKRVKLAVPARICVGEEESTVLFQEIATTIDVSRQGLLLSAVRREHIVGERLQVTCPYWDTPTAINIPRQARVVRSVLMASSNFALAIEYLPISQGKDLAGNSIGRLGDRAQFLGVQLAPQTSRYLREMLEKDGYSVNLVPGTQEALKFLQYNNPDVMVAEAEGDGISGNDLCAIVKTSTRLRHVPVILLTRLALPSSYAISRELGAIMCIPLPCDPERLRRAIHMVTPPQARWSTYSASTAKPEALLSNLLSE
jgi:CheY-like chemotaxis protein